MSRVLKKPPVKPVSSVAKKRVVRDRLNCRIDGRIKERAEAAAILLGQDLTSFTETALNEKAQEVLEREERIVLSERDFARFVESISGPQPPTQALIEARRAYRQLQKELPENNL